MKPTDKKRLTQLVIGICLAVGLSVFMFGAGGPSDESVHEMVDSFYQMREVAGSVEDLRTAESALPRMKKIVARMEELNKRPWKWNYGRKEIQAEVNKRNAGVQLETEDFVRFEIGMLSMNLQKKSNQLDEEFWPLLDDTVRDFQDQALRMNHYMVDSLTATFELVIRLIVLILVLKWLLQLGFGKNEPVGQRLVYQILTVALGFGSGYGLWGAYHHNWGVLTIVVYASVGIAIGLAAWRAILPGKARDKTVESPTAVVEGE